MAVNTNAVWSLVSDANRSRMIFRVLFFFPKQNEIKTIHEQNEMRWHHCLIVRMSNATDIQTRRPFESIYF